MYQLISTEDTLRIPAEYMRKGQSLDDHIDRLATLAFEGKFDEMNRFVVLTTHHEPIGRGRIIHGDGAVYQKVRFKAVVFTIEDLEVFEGAVSDMIQIGAFVRIGPMEALLHKSQIMDEMVDLNEGQNIIMARNSGKRLEVGGTVRARVVTLSINANDPRQSRIGLTCKQSGLGDPQWLLEDRQQRRE